MKKIISILTLVIVLILSFPQVVYANMMDPIKSDVGSSITFEKNDTISVLSEVLNITVNGSEADIEVTYKMKNTTNENISTDSMFLSPNIKNSGVNVLVNNKETTFTTESYALYRDTEVKKEKWQYAVLTPYKPGRNNTDRAVDTINFEMTFAPNEEYDVVVSYKYALGGYPDLDFDAKRGDIEYYLLPAAMWKDFSSLTINLYLDEDMPVVKKSTLHFKKCGKRTYQYKSDTLPDDDLIIIIDENWRQNIRSIIKSPYLFNYFITDSPFILGGLFIFILIIRHIIKNKKNKKTDNIK